MPRRVAFLLALALATLAALAPAACTPSVHGDDWYACETHDDCPAHVRFCSSEHLCVGVLDRDAARGDGGIIEPAHRCGDGLPACAPGDACIGGICSPPCSASSTCPPAALCIAGQCRAPCDASASCGAHECLAATDADGARRNVCLDPALATGAGELASCGTCAPPFTCVAGACLRECGSGGLCRTDEACIAAPPETGASVCLHRCAPSCPSATMCGTPPGQSQACLPTAWM